MDIKKILQNIPEEVLERVAQQVGVDTGVVVLVAQALGGELSSEGILEIGKDLLDADGDGQVIDDMAGLAGSLFGGK